MLYSRSVQQLLNRENLYARRIFETLRFVEPGFSRFFQHWFGRRFHSDEHTNFGFLALNDAPEVADVRHLGVSGFDGEDDLLGLARAVIMEEESSVDAAIGT